MSLSLYVKPQTVLVEKTLLCREFCLTSTFFRVENMTKRWFPVFRIKDKCLRSYTYTYTHSHTQKYKNSVRVKENKVILSFEWYWNDLVLQRSTFSHFLSLKVVQTCVLHDLLEWGSSMLIFSSFFKLIIISILFIGVFYFNIKIA